MLIALTWTSRAYNFHQILLSLLNNIFWNCLARATTRSQCTSRLYQHNWGNYTGREEMYASEMPYIIILDTLMTQVTQASCFIKWCISPLNSVDVFCYREVGKFWLDISLWTICKKIFFDKMAFWVQCKKLSKLALHHHMTISVGEKCFHVPIKWLSCSKFDLDVSHPNSIIALLIVSDVAQLPAIKNENAQEKEPLEGLQW